MALMMATFALLDETREQKHYFQFAEWNEKPYDP